MKKFLDVGEDAARVLSTGGKAVTSVAAGTAEDLSKENNELTFTESLFKNTLGTAAGGGTDFVLKKFAADKAGKPLFETSTPDAIQKVQSQTGLNKTEEIAMGTVGGTATGAASSGTKLITEREQTRP